MNTTKIEYGTHAWNPVTGCSYGCPWGCWAENVFTRHSAVKAYHGGHDFRVPMLHPERLNDPLRKKKPSRVLVSFMGDLFGPEVPASFIGWVCAKMAIAQQHQFFLLTKRAENLNVLGSGILPDNAFLGVTVTTQADADKRIPLLLTTPSDRRWISAEPLLGPMDLSAFMGVTPNITGERAVQFSMLSFVVVGSIDRPSVRWPAPKREWIESIREQCQAAGVPLWEKNNLRTRGPVRDRKLVQELPT